MKMGGASKSAMRAGRGRFGEVVTWQLSRDKGRGCEMRGGVEVVVDMYSHIPWQAININSRIGRYPGPCEEGRTGNLGGQAARSGARGHPLPRTVARTRQRTRRALSSKAGSDPGLTIFGKFRPPEE